MDNHFHAFRLFFMLRRFPIESKGRRKKLHEVWHLLCRSSLDDGILLSHYYKYSQLHVLVIGLVSFSALSWRQKISECSFWWICSLDSLQWHLKYSPSSWVCWDLSVPEDSGVLFTRLACKQWVHWMVCLHLPMCSSDIEPGYIVCLLNTETPSALINGSVCHLPAITGLLETESTSCHC